MLAYGIPLEFRGGVHSLSVHIVYYECSSAYTYSSTYSKMISAALSSCSVSSTNEYPRINKSAKGRPGKYNGSRPYCSQEFHFFFANRNSSKNMHLQIKIHTRGANPTLYARKKLSGLFEKFPKVQLEKKRGGIPAQDAEHQNYLILDHYYIYFWRPCPYAQRRVGSLYFACTFI